MINCATGWIRSSGAGRRSISCAAKDHLDRRFINHARGQGPWNTAACDPRSRVRGSRLASGSARDDAGRPSVRCTGSAAPDPAPGALRKLAFRHGPRRPRCVGQPHLLIVAPRVEALGLLAAVPGWRSGFDRVSVWILDSFWTEALSTPLGMEHVDHVFITWGGDLEAYRAIAPAATTVDWLPWGTDALGLGGAPAHRPVDIQRLGRQPEEWDDDIRSMARLKAEGLRFAGRPDAGSYESLLSDHLQQARCVMAHSNLAHAVSYTHPSKEYMTARWTDAFACDASWPACSPAAIRFLPRSIPRRCRDRAGCRTGQPVGPAQRSRTLDPGAWPAHPRDGARPVRLALAAAPYRGADGDLRHGA
jgi:hypothetical protein